MRPGSFFRMCPLLLKEVLKTFFLFHRQHIQIYMLVYIAFTECQNYFNGQVCTKLYHTKIYVPEVPEKPMDLRLIITETFI